MSSQISPPRLQSSLARPLRYVQASSGPIATAVAHFACSLLLLHTLDLAAFGRISFLLVASQLSGGIWSALFCAPLPVLLTRAANQGEGCNAAVQRCMLSSNLVGAIIALMFFYGISLGIGLSLDGALLFGAYAACFLLRWFARAEAYAAAQPLKVAISDLTYSIVLLLGLVLIWQSPMPSLSEACAALLAAAVAGLLPFGRGYLKAQFGRMSISDIRSYIKVWRVHSRWSLVGVVTTEATANSHAYLLALVSGPTAFAPIAASALLIRPIGVVVNALSEFERPRIARQIGQDDITQAHASVRYFRSVLMLAWGGSALVAAILLALNPGLVFPSSYDLDFLIAGTALWMAVAFVRQWRAPESVFLQAAGEFRVLAQASMVSSLVSVISVAILLIMAGALWSIAGILLGETLCTVWTVLQARRYRQQLARQSKLVASN